MGKKYYKDTSPLAMGRQQKGSVAQKIEQKKKKKKEEQQTGVQSKPQSFSAQNTASAYQRNGQTRRNTGSTQQKQPQQRTSTYRSVNKSRTAQTAEEMQKQRQSAIDKSLQTNRERRVYQKQNEDLRERYGTKKPQTAKEQEQQKQSKVMDTKSAPSYYGASMKQGKAGSLGKDLADTVEHTLKQTAASESRMFWESAKGNASIDPFIRNITTEEERRKAEEKANRKIQEYGAKVEKESLALENLKEGHSWLGQRTLEATSSGVGMLTDIAWGPASLGHMWIRSTGTARGTVNRRTEALRNNLKQTGLYSDEELDEMFKNADAMDMLNAGINGGIEVLSEKLFTGIGVARKVGGTGILDNVASKLFNKVGGKMLSGPLGRILLGTAEEITEEEVGNPLQTYTANLIYGNKFQEINEDATRRMLQKESDSLLSQIESPEQAQIIATRLSSDEFLDEAVKSYKETGFNDEESQELAEKTRDYLEASLTGDTERMEELRNEMAMVMTSGDRSMKEHWGLQDAIDVAVSTAIMTSVSGVPNSINTQNIGNAYKNTAGMDAVRNLAEITTNWDPNASDKARAIADRIDSGEDITGTQVAELIGQASEAATEAMRDEDSKWQVAQSRMARQDLRVTPARRTEDGTLVLSENTQQRYDQIVKETVDRYANLERIGESEGISTQDVELGADIAAAQMTGVISAEQINELVRPENEGVRRVFEDVTGIDLSQFNKYDRSGLLIAETNIAMRRGLMALASDNLVNSARLEQIAWNDEARGEIGEIMKARMEGKGTEALMKALDKVDPRDRDLFVLTGEAARDVYATARRTLDDWANVRRDIEAKYKGVDIDSLKAVFEAAKQDKEEAENNYIGQSVKAHEQMQRSSLSEGEPAYVPGDFQNESERVLKGSEILLLSSVANVIGINVIMTDDLAPNENGRYVPDTRTIYLNSRNTMNDNLKAILSHEVTHHLAVFAPEEYIKLSRFVMDRWFKENPEQFQNHIKRIQKLYKEKRNQNLSEEQALEELIADSTVSFWNDERFIRDIAEKEPTLAQKIINSIKDFLRKLRNILSSGNVQDEDVRTGLFELIDEYDTAYKMWMNAYKTARRGQSQETIDAWQEMLLNNEEDIESRSSLSDEDMIVKGKTARWTDKRIRRLLTQYGGDDNYSSAYAVLMSPKDFLTLTLDDEYLALWNKELEKLPDDMKSMSYEEMREYTRTKGRETGEWINPELLHPLDEKELEAEWQTPYLIIRSSEGVQGRLNKIKGHEGRHRMRALMEAGIESVPVVIEDKDTEYTKEHLGFMLFNPQSFYGEQVNPGESVWVEDLVPIRDDNKDELIQKFGGEADVRFSITYTQEEMDEHRQWLIDSASESYGEAFTDDINESGFIFPDGSLPRMGMYGSRADDHNLVVGAYDDIGYDTSMHPKADAMARFLNEGNIRYMPENGSIELGTEVEPTFEQYQRIREMDYVNMIEFTSPDGRTVAYKEYDGDRSGVVNDIKRFYRTGEIGGSSLSQFRYSISETDSEGRTLSEGQREFFKDSKVVDEDGNLQVVYHGTYEEGFTVFKSNKFLEEQNGLSRIKGYFSTSQDYASVYGDTGAYYLNIRNPLFIPDDSKRLAEWIDWFAEQGVKGIEFDSGIEKDGVKGYYFGDGTRGYALWELFDIGDYWYGDGNLTEMIENAGYDGIYWEEGKGWNLGEGETVEGNPLAYMPFNENAIKRTDNLDPTEDADIRYSISSLAEAVGLSFSKKNGMTVLTDASGNVVDEVTPAFLKKTPLGRLLTLSNTREGYNIMDEVAVYNRLKFLSDLLNMIIKTQDVDLLWAVSGTLGYDPTHLVDENTPQSKIKEQKSKFASITGNSDPQYKSTIDFTTICVKTQAIIDAMSALMKKLNRGLTEHEIIDIVYNETHMAGEQVPCPVCYVFSRWVGLGNLFSKIQEFQKHYPEGMDMSLIREEYDTLNEEVGQMAKTLGIRGTDAREKLYRQTIERKDELDELAYYDRITDEQKKELESIDRRLDVLDHWSWLGKSRLDANYKEVPADILFDINAGREFATEYPAVWKFRTTRGPSLGKAAAPYTPSRLGDTIRGIASPGALKNIGEGSRPFLAKNLSKSAKKTFDRAVINAKRQNRMNGQRLQSTSDFRFEYALDYILSFLELEAVGAKAQMYTKVPEAVKFLASTNAEVNCSIMPLGRGIDENGNLIFSDVTGMAWEDAVALSRAYDNVQPILVAIGRDHLIAAMANKDITFIIPYHASGSSEGRYVSMMRTVGETVEDRTDFAEYESEHVIEDATPEQKNARKLRLKILTGDAAKLTDKEQEILKGNEILRQLYIRIYGMDETGKETLPDPKYVENFDEDGHDADCFGVFLTKDQANVMMPYEYWDKKSTIAEADAQGQAYIDYCKSLGITPVFSGVDSKGKYHEDMDFTSYPGYWKTLIDRCMYNNDGTYHKQSAVSLDKVDLDMLDSEMMRKEVVKPLQVNDPAKTDAIVEKALKRIEAEETKFSISAKYDQSYMDAVNSGNMEEAQRLVDEAARTAGMRVVHRYHGSMDASHTVFSKRAANVDGNSGAGFYFTSNEDDALGHYKDSKGADNYFKVRSFADYLMQIEGEWNGVEIDSDETAMRVAREELNKNPGMYDVYLNYHTPYVRNYGKSTNIYDDIIDHFDDSVVDRSEYDTEWDYDDALWEAKLDALYEAINDAIQQAYDYLRDTYDYVDLPSSYDLASDLAETANVTQHLTWDDILDAISYKEITIENDDRIGDEVAWGHTEVTRAILEAFGYDAIEDKEVDTKFGQLSREMMTGTEHIIVFRPEQIKLSDPVTYAEDGSVIPLSERFDPNNDDIRYSLPTLDSYGDVLSDGQMEFFKESKARNDEGRLIRFYHYTDDGRFTVFDPSYSDDHRSLFFTDDWSVGMTYTSEWRPTEYSSEELSSGNEENTSGYYPVYLNLKNPLIVDADMSAWNMVLPKGYERMNIEMSEWNGKWEVVYSTAERDLSYDVEWGDSESKQFDSKEEAEAFIVETFGQTMLDYLTNNSYHFDDIYSIENQEIMPVPASLPGIDTGETTESTRQIAQRAYAEGYDGVIFKNLVDLGGEQESPMAWESTIAVAFSSDQIKLVDNTDPTNNPDIRYSIVDEGDALDWLASQYDLDDVPLEDEQAEEGRVRMAKSKQEFVRRKNVLWNERWLTEGKILDVESVRKSITDVVMGAMANSDTTRQYKSELVEKMLLKAKNAFWLMKSGKYNEAAEVLWDAAYEMIQDVDFIEDEVFKHYKGLRDYLRTTPIRLGEEYWSDVDYANFRRRNFGRIKLVKGDTNLDQVLDDLMEIAPEWFSESAFEEHGLKREVIPDILLQIEATLDAIQPYRIAYSSEEAEHLAGFIADDLYDIVYEGQEYKSIADTFKERYDAKTKALKQRHEEAMRKAKEQFEKKLGKEKLKLKEYKAKQKSAKEHAKHFGSIAKNIDWLTDRLINETKDKNIPEGFRRSLAHLLMQFDMQTERSKKLEAKYGPAQKTLRMRELKDMLGEIAKDDDTGEFRYDGYVFYLMDSLAKKVDGKPIDSLDIDDLIVIDTMLKSIRHNFANYNKIRIEEERVAVADIGDSTIQMMRERIEKYGQRAVYRSAVISMMDKLVNEGEETPIYFFERLDPTGQGIGAMYKELRRGEDTHIRNIDFLRQRFKQMFEDYFKDGKPGSDLEEWRDDSQSQTFNLKNGSITLNPAQIMSLYCLSKRAQAMGHILGAGIVVSPVTFGAKMKDGIKAVHEHVQSVRITHDEVLDIISKLTPEQVKLADEMQSLLNNEMAAWGNETSLEMYGIKLFREKDYFPIKSSNESLAKTPDSFEAQEKIKNFGFTKPLVKNANNAIMIDDIFSVVADHCNKMALYNAMAIPISDFMRVYNYKHTDEEGNQTTVQAMIGEAFTRKANQYIMKFIGDVNGNTKTRSDAVDDLMNKALANYKKASIGMNLRVALQQPTAIFRSLMVIDPKYFKGVKVSRKEMKEMFERCPIALWKSWGHYDMDMGRDIEDIMMNNDWSKWDKISMGIYGELDNLTWSMIWQAVKNEVRATHPEVKEGSAEWWALCNERASEVYDKTQVVDSIFHRSDTMRSKNTLTKMATSFMAEPTLTYNVFRDSLAKARDLIKDGKTEEAAKLIGKMVLVLALNAAAVSASAALWDAVRGKGDDDDDDKRFGHLWLVNFMNNFGENINMINNIYFVKDIWSLKDGWGTSNMALEGFETIFKGFEQVKKKLEKGDAYINKSTGKPYTWWDVMTTLLGGFGYVTGYPVKTVMRDLKAIAGKLGIDVFAADDSFDEIDQKKTNRIVDSLFEKLGYKKIGSDETGDEEASGSVPSREDLPDSLTDEQKDEIIKSAEKRSKKASEKAEEQNQLNYDDMLYKALKSASGLEGEEYNKKIYSSVSNGLKGYIAEGDYQSIGMMRTVIEEAGGDVEYFDNRVLEESKTAFKKSLGYDLTPEQRWAMKSQWRYMVNHGMTEEEISSDIIYKSDLAKDMKVAYRIGDNGTIYEAMVPLVDAGLMQSDLERLYENRNRMDLSKYNGRYKDRLKSTGNFIWPTDGVITSGFGRRSAPTRGASNFHNAIDIGAPQGTPVVAADGGEVIEAGSNGGYGNSVGIRHDDGTISYYNHLYAWNVKVGDTVAQGQQIGQVGSTGISTGPHLDFRLYKDGDYLDPEKYLNKRGA